MYAAINPDDLMSALATVTTLVDEAKIRVNENGVTIKAVDPANVGMVEMHLDRDAFERLETGVENDPDTDEVVLGVNLNNFNSQLKDIADEPIGEDEQTLHIEMNEETRKLSIWGVPGSMEFTTALIDPDSIRQEPDIPSMDLPGHVLVMSSYLDHAVKTAKKYSEHITLGINDDDASFYMTAEGDTDDWNAVLDEEHFAVESLTTANVASIFSLDYFDSIRKGIPKNVSVKIEMGQEFPVRIMFNFLDSNASVKYMIAPRIQEE